jgi:DNA-binding HxlR family transcriptional regulator
VPHVEYALSGLGETMRPIIDTLERWGTGYQKRVKESAEN